MAKAIGVADAKRRFSELASRTAFRGERFLIERKGTPVAAMVSVDDLHSLEQSPAKESPKGLLAATGAWAGYRGLDELVDEIYRARARAADRPVRKIS